jgi:hypothetical protein
MDDEDAGDRVKGRLEQAERAVEKFVTRRLKAVQPGLEKVCQIEPFLFIMCCTAAAHTLPMRIST